MKRQRLLAVLLAFVLSLGTVEHSQSAGSKSYSSGGGRSASSSSSSRSGSSSGRSYSSGGGKSYSSGNKSYSSPGYSRPGVTVTPTPVSGTGGKTYSSSKSPTVGKTSPAVSPSGSSPPRTGGLDGGAAAAQKRVESKGTYVPGPAPRPSYASPPRPSLPNNPPSISSGGKSYSSGNKSYASGGSSGPSVTVAPMPPTPVPGSGTKTYSSDDSYRVGNKKYTAVSPSGSSKPQSGTFDGSAAAAQKRVESKTSYLQGAQPKPTYTSPTGQSVPIKPAGDTAQQIRAMDRTVYITRERRIYSTYSPYYSRPFVVYNDPYNSYFWWWMLDRSLDDRAMWAYSHRYDMDSARYQALLAQDARLETRIQQLEAQKVARDPSFTPAGIDPDLQYTDNYVDAVYNPHVETRTRSHGLRTMFWVLFCGAVLFGVIYLVFFKNWQFAEKGAVKL